MAGWVNVICRNRSEYLYCHAFCEDNDWLTPLLTSPEKFPFVVCLDFDKGDSMWTDRLDRNMEYTEFVDFIKMKPND